MVISTELQRFLNNIYSCIKFVFYFLLLEFIVFEAIHCYEDSYNYWYKVVLKQNSDADRFLYVWKTRLFNLLETIMRDGFLPRFLKFMMTKFLDHGLMIMVVSMAIVHGRLPSYFLLLLDEIGLGFIGDGVEKMVAWISGNNDSTSLEDVPDLDDEDDIVARKTKQKKKKMYKIPIKKEKPDTWLTYDKHLGVIPLGVAKKWREEEKRRKELVGGGGSSGANRVIPPVRNGRLDTVD